MATTVSFDGVDATDVTVASTTSLTCTVPAGVAAGAADVVVATSGDSVTVTDGYTYQPPAPALSQVLPGTIRPGAVALVLGTGANGAGVAHVGATNVTVSASIPKNGGFSLGSSATTPLTIGTTYDVSFTNASGQDSNVLAGALEVVDAATLPAVAAITAVAPASVARGGTVTLTGTGFVAGDTGVALVSSTNASTYLAPATVSATSVTFVVPAGTATGSTRVYVYTPNGVSNVSALPTYPLQVTA